MSKLSPIPEGKSRRRASPRTRKTKRKLQALYENATETSEQRRQRLSSEEANRRFNNSLLARKVQPSTLNENLKMLNDELKQNTMYIKNYIHRPTKPRKKKTENDTIFNQELKKSPMYVKNYLYRPPHTRKAAPRKSVSNKPAGLTNIPLGTKI